ncbi:hypothetical protein SpCBS45565_g03417 [Spizellomyces sp. 'palustris']|nr:hypothetical protein SpCBS45565_g03417 [Spizellomyces sp. 'palustris']
MVVLTVLTNKEEEIVFADLKKNATTKCRQYLEELVQCTRNRTLTVYWACQKQNRALNECLGQYTTDEERDKRREQFLAGKKEWRKYKRRAAQTAESNDK